MQPFSWYEFYHEGHEGHEGEARGQVMGKANPHDQDADLHGYTQILIFELFHPCTVFLHVLHALHGKFINFLLDSVSLIEKE
jgi:hypothetical protein